MLSMIVYSFGYSQELYVSTEPASTMPAGAVSIKAKAKWVDRAEGDGMMQRYSPEVLLGISKKFMLHGAVSFSDMYSSRLRWEGIRMYGQYRFYSKAQLHKHFRMAVFGAAAATWNQRMYDEISLEGDQSGAQLGVIFTQLVNRTAISFSGSYVQTVDRKKYEGFSSQAINYTLSAGYLVLPKIYISFKQTNLNLYAELIAHQLPQSKRYFIDLAPALQFIFHSTLKCNIGYRFEVSGDINRMGSRGWMISLEKTWLNAL